MTSAHPLRRALARFCSSETMTRVVDPIFADIRFEDARVTLRGGAALAKALALHGLTSIPSWFAAACSDDDYAMTKVALLVAALGILTAIPFVANTVMHFAQFKSVSLVSLGILVLPSMLVVSLPSSLVVAVPLALRRVRLTRRLFRRTLLMSALTVVGTCGVVTFLVPETNQSFRVKTYRAMNGRGDLARGPNEEGWTSLRREIAYLSHTHGEGHVAAALLENTYQLRLAIVAAALPLGFTGLAICASNLGRRRPLAIGVTVGALYWTSMWLEQDAAKALISSGPFFPAYLGAWIAWTPNVVLLIAASAILRVRDSALPAPGVS
jgi:hypothetical protein